MEKNKKNVFAVFCEFIKKCWLNFIDSFKYNPSKIATIILLIPCIVLGFCLTFHFTASKAFVTYNSTIQYVRITNGEITVPDWFVASSATADRAKEYAQSIAVSLHSGFQLFALMVLGAVMMFVAMNVSSKRNLGSSIQATLCTAAIILFGIFWIMNFTRTNYIYNVAKYTELQGTKYSITSSANMVSIICVIVAMISSVVGTILSYIFRDKTYKKEKM